MEILLTVRNEVNENGRFYVWQAAASAYLLHEQDSCLVTSTRYRVFKLTERAHQLLDEKGAPDLTEPAVSKHMGEPISNPEPVDRLKPSYARAKALYEWAMEHMDGAENMTYAELYAKLTNDPHCAGEGLPGNAAAFARYCRAAGVRRNAPRRGKRATRSVRRASDM